jgi:DNA-binding NarL/FixJ family response regulator
LLNQRHQYRTVLVAGSDARIAGILCTELLQLGCFAAGPFTSNAEAVQWLADNPADAAIVDVSLDDGPSMRLARALTQDNIPLVFFGSYSAGSGTIHAEVPGQPGIYRESSLPDLLDALESLGLAEAAGSVG